jgi:hypothetical protein
MSDLSLDLELPTDIPDLPPPWLPNEDYLAWMKAEWDWLERDGRLAQIINERPRPVEEPFVLP